MSKKSPARNLHVIRDNSTSETMNTIKVSLGILLAVFAFALYSQSLFYSYTLDDETIITENNLTKQGLAAIPEILKHDYWYGYKDENRVPQYRPIPCIIFAIEWQLFPNGAWFGHLINVILYSLTCWLLFQLLMELFENIKAKYHLLLAFTCTLIYAAHPIHTEVVDNIKSLDEILCFLFNIIAARYALRFLSRGIITEIFLSALFFLLALMCKETAIVFILIIPMLLYYFTNATPKNIGLTFLIFCLSSGIYFSIRHFALQGLPINNFIRNNNSLSLAPNIITQKATAFYVLLRYIFLLILPYPLTCTYSYAEIPLQKITDILPIIAIVFYTFIGTFAILKMKSKKIISFGILFYLITLVPVSNLFILIGSPMNERFLYMPSLGFSLITGAILMQLNTETIKNSYVNILGFLSGNTTKFKVVLLLILGIFSLLTFSRNPDWKDNQTLISHDANVSENSAVIHYTLGNILFRNIYPQVLNKARQRVILDSAIHELKKALEIKKEFPYPEARTCLGDCFYESKDYPDAINNYEIAIRQSTKSLANVHNNMAYCLRAINQFDKAMMEVDSALIIDPKFIDAYFNKAFILSATNKLNEAILENKKVLDIDSKNENALKNIGLLYRFMGDSLNADIYLDKTKSHSR